MNVDLFNKEGAKIGAIEISDAVFGVEVRPHLHHEAVRHHRASLRAGTHATLNRKAVSGSTRKLYKQKGVGRARHGSVKANNFVGGGIVFGPSPRDYSYKLSKKFRRAALRSALSEKASTGHLRVVDDLRFTQPKTRTAAEMLGRHNASKALVVDRENSAAELSFRNIPSAQYSEPTGLNVYSVVGAESLIISVAALRELEGKLEP